MKVVPFLVILCTSLLSCNDDVPDDYLCEEVLYPKPLAHIKHCVEGKWRHYRTQGGFAGIVHDYENSFMEIKGNHMLWTIEGQQFVNAQMLWSIGENTQGNNAYRIEVLVGSGSPPDSEEIYAHFAVGTFRNDTLGLGDIGPDGLGYLFVRVNE